MSKITKEQLDDLIAAYAKGEPKISDEEYDKLMEEYIAENGEESRPFNRNKQSSAVNDIVGTLPKLYGVKKPMREGMPTFEKWLKANGEKFYSEGNDDLDSNILIIQPKFDGCSVAFDTKSKRFFTRGDYDNGESMDVTDLFKDRITNISLSFNNVADYDDVDAIKFEAIMDEETYNDYLASGRFPKPYKTPRSAASAIISGRITELVDTITLIPLRYYINGEQKLHPYLSAMSRTTYFDSIQSDISTLETRIEDALADAQMFIDNILGNNASVCYHGDYCACDGVVVSVVNNKDRAVNTKYEVAIKILENIKETKLLDIKWQYGKGGNITPVAVLEPVKFGNITVTNCGLGSFGRVSAMGLKRNDTVRIMHNIVPYFVASEHDGDEIIPMPTTCPICGAKLQSNVVKVIRCNNPNCAGLQMGNIIRYAETMKMFGVGEGVISKLFNMGYVKSIPDLYKIDADKLMHEPGFGETSVKKMINSIEEASTNVPVERWLGALPILAVSVITWRNILDEVYGRDVAAGDEIRRLIQKLNYDEFIKMLDLYNTEHNIFYVKNITNYFKKNWTEVHELIDYVTFSSTNNIGTRGLVVISGTRDKVLIDRLKKLGYNVTDQFNKNAIAVLVPSYNFKSSKTKKAEKYGIEVIEILEFLDRFYGGGF